MEENVISRPRSLFTASISNQESECWPWFAVPISTLFSGIRAEKLAQRLLLSFPERDWRCGISPHFQACSLWMNVPWSPRLTSKAFFMKDKQEQILWKSAPSLDLRKGISWQSQVHKVKTIQLVTNSTEDLGPLTSSLALATRNFHGDLGLQSQSIISKKEEEWRTRYTAPTLSSLQNIYERNWPMAPTLCHPDSTFSTTWFHFTDILFDNYWKVTIPYSTKPFSW